MPSSQSPHELPNAQQSDDSNPPENPKLNDVWVDAAGDLFTWDGEHWVPFEDLPFLQPNTRIKNN